MTDKILWMDDVEKLTHLTWPTINKYIKEKNFPPFSKIGNKKVWRESSVVAWMDMQIDGSGTDDEK